MYVVLSVITSVWSTKYEHVNAMNKNTHFSQKFASYSFCVLLPISKIPLTDIRANIHTQTHTVHVWYIHTKL